MHDAGEFHIRTNFSLGLSDFHDFAGNSYRVRLATNGQQIPHFFVTTRKVTNAGVTHFSGLSEPASLGESKCQPISAKNVVALGIRPIEGKCGVRSGVENVEATARR